VTAVDGGPRRYRLAALRRTGLFGAVPPAVVAAGAVGVVMGWTAVRTGAPIPLALLPLGLCAVFVFGRFRGGALHEVLPRVLVWATRAAAGRRWCRPVPLVTGDGPIVLPRLLNGVEVLEFDTSATAGAPVGMVRDRRANSVSVVLRVTGDGQFALSDASVQDGRVDLWGLALAGFCREATPVVRVTWRDWTTPSAGAGDRPLVGGPRQASPPRRSYLALVEEAAGSTWRHEVLVEVTVDIRRAQPGQRHRPQRRLESAVAVLLDEARLFAARLEHAGLCVAGPLGPALVVEAVRVRSDPRLLSRVGQLSRSLAAAAGRAPADFGPMAVEEAWGHVRVDGAVHRSWWFARWPRRDVPAGWLDPLLHEIPATRTVTVVFEPITPSRSDRDIDKESVTRETNSEDRARRGFRVRSVDRKAVRDVTEREAELNAGYRELAYVGLLTLTADTVEELDQLGPLVEQTAAQSGVELQALYGRQGDGWVSSLPLGRSVARKMTP
jgi:hypothetical protein